MPAGKQLLSENSQFTPLVKLLAGQATGPVGPCVIGFWQTPVLGLHGPSPTAFEPSEPPTQVAKTFGSR